MLTSKKISRELSPHSNPSRLTRLPIIRVANLVDSRWDSLIKNKLLLLISRRIKHHLDQVLEASRWGKHLSKRPNQL